MKFTLNQFSQRIKSLRRQKGVTARQMSRDLNQNDSYISRIECGTAYPSLPAFFDICSYLEIEAADFFDLRQQKPGEQEYMLDLLAKAPGGLVEAMKALLEECVNGRSRERKLRLERLMGSRNEKQ